MRVSEKTNAIRPSDNFVEYVESPPTQPGPNWFAKMLFRYWSGLAWGGMVGARPFPLGTQLEFLGSVEVVVGVAVVDVVPSVLFGTDFDAAWCAGFEPHALNPTAMPTADTQRAVITDGRSGSLVSD
jgi:hypothetical protein